MSYIHVLLEAYCGYDYRKDKKESVPKFCKQGTNNPGYHCFDNECPFRSYTVCPNELAYVNEVGEVKDRESFIGFGGEMDSDGFDIIEHNELISLWERICKKKIKEAYDEYMILKGEITQNNS
ncbi:hypothetical protein [Vallitalea guaymasensis]|uniref:hypothetical protein n=1 Tax=Vallitalea guaymasensis TaxID=1185412 RepID=UPI000DE3E602|nr:hypothetical protein [Vallitalea guaymasensis]